MNPPSATSPRSPVGALIRLGSALLLAGLAGCDRNEPPAAAAKPAPIPAATAPRGEPIRGQPIRAAVAAPATNVAKSEPVPAVAIAAAVTSTNVPALPAGGATSAVAVAVASAPTSTNSAPVGTPANALVVGFDKLGAFQYTLPEGPVDTNVVVATKADSQIPGTIRALNNQFVSLKGFMLPLKVEKGLVTELLIMRDQSMCCYGTVPRINEWVSVKMASAGVKPIMDQPVTLFGRLKVGEMYENGYLVGIYALEGDRMAGPLDL